VVQEGLNDGNKALSESLDNARLVDCFCYCVCFRSRRGLNIMDTSDWLSVEWTLKLGDTEKDASAESDASKLYELFYAESFSWSKIKVTDIASQNGL
jgi:hypothetical protein